MELNLKALQELCEKYGRSMDNEGNIFLKGAAFKHAYVKIVTKKRTSRFHLFDSHSTLLVSYPAPAEKQVECLQMMLEKYWYAKPIQAPEGK